MSSSAKALRTAVYGVSGYSGGELVRLLLAHPHLQGVAPLLLGRSEGAVSLSSIHPQLTGVAGLSVIPFDWNILKRESIDVLFCALPHEQSREIVPPALEHGLRVIDLSGAWRLHDPANAAVYNLIDADPVAAAKVQAEAAYGSPELNAPAIARATLVANPGCYATSCILALAPLVRANIVDLDRGIICDAKSGVSGAGKALTYTTQFMSVADSLSAYAVFGHRHTGELLEQLKLNHSQIQFTPHLLPIPRGILSTIYVSLSRISSRKEIQECFDRFYASSPLVRIRKSPTLPEIRHVAYTNVCDIGFELGPDGKRLVIVSCLDNLLKGAASQAIQNMNLMAGWHEAEGLL